jgi:hypothetical protein
MLQMTPVSPIRPQPAANDETVAFQIVTWYMADPLSLAPLVSLLTTNDKYEEVQKLELVVPTNTQNVVPEEVIEKLIAYLENSIFLEEVVLWTITEKGSTQKDQEEDLSLVRKLEHAGRYNLNVDDCLVRTIQKGNPRALCDSLSPNETRKRHLSMDATLLEGMNKTDFTQQLAKHVAWDRSTQHLLLKDFTRQQWLSTLLEKMAFNSSLQTIKIVYDPSTITPPVTIDTTAIYTLLSSRILQLQRLYFVNCRFRPPNTQPLIEALVQYPDHQTIHTLEFVVCQFDSGTGTQLQTLVQQTQSLRQVSFQYPILGRAMAKHARYK